MLTAHQEHEKYTHIWGVPDYRKWSPGMDNVKRFMDVVKPKPGESLLDIGCGSGSAGLEFVKHGLDVWWLDITQAGLDAEIPHERFLQETLWNTPLLGWDYGFCCDVMEHIPPEFTMLVLDRILAACGKTWFQVALVPDNFGPQLIGEPLHLTVRPYTWWRDRFYDLNAIIDDSRDLLQSGLYVVRRRE